MNMSAGGNRVPDYQREIRELRAEIRNLWQALGRSPDTPPVQKQMIFSWSGTVSGTKTSGPWIAESNLTITGCTMGHASGGGTTTAELVLNGVDVFTFVLNGSQRGGSQMRQAVSVGDRVQLRVVGSGGRDLTCALTYITDGGW